MLLEGFIYLEYLIRENKDFLWFMSVMELWKGSLKPLKYLDQHSACFALISRNALQISTIDFNSQMTLNARGSMKWSQWLE
ncbi:hypothetical protein CEXT_219521 [Caerostris extrusa]|uniref:Uncharacterized protein n=1 Tax=Caerostris extrusa TaxID=172846 RepID=A0AAV4STU2_CAEEX|nr:hypothetical protein CEXT_219521 [Caerostris extrusa]